MKNTETYEEAIKRLSALFRVRDAEKTQLKNELADITARFKEKIDAISDELMSISNEMSNTRPAVPKKVKPNKTK